VLSRPREPLWLLVPPIAALRALSGARVYVDNMVNLTDRLGGIFFCRSAMPLGHLDSSMLVPLDNGRARQPVGTRPRGGNHGKGGGDTSHEGVVARGLRSMGRQPEKARPENPGLPALQWRRRPFAHSGTRPGAAAGLLQDHGIVVCPVTGDLLGRRGVG
jgi:hypothetical protein